MKRPAAHAALLGVAVLLVGGAAPLTAEAAGAQFVIKDFMYTPVTLTVKAGSAVTWVNHDDEPHTVVSATGLFRSNAVDTNETFVFTFDKPGTYRFVCSIHPKMMGTVVVE